jgi:hypothetical protein
VTPQLMKKILLALGLVISLSASALGQPIAEGYLLQKLTTKRDSAKALESVLKTPDEYSPLVLFAGSDVALQQNRLEDSAFLFYTARLRSFFDKMCFPPAGTGSQNPFILYGALSETIGGSVKPAIMSEPKAFANVVLRLRAWIPKAPKDYLPGYKFLKRKTEKEAYETQKPLQIAYINRLSDVSILLNDPEYFTAFWVFQNYDLAPEGKGPTKAEFDKAYETMLRIEKEKGIKGSATARSSKKDSK